MVSQKENRLDFSRIMNEGKIFLAKLSQGAIGEENAYLLGSLLVSKFHQMAMARQEVGISERRPFYLYIDEFHNFMTPSMASILSGARKYRLGLVLAHQDLRQLWSRDTEVANAVLSNPYTRISFRVGDDDARKLEDGFSFFTARDLQNLGLGEAICRIERAEYDFNLRTLPLPVVEMELAQQRRDRLVALSRERYGRQREEVEKELAWEQPLALPVSPVETERPRLRKREPVLTVPVTEPVRVAGKDRVKPVPPEPVPPGRGGQQHKYLQELIRRWAESKGYRATIEKQILDGLGSVDVALEKDGRAIACEISVTSTTDQEVGNIEKCLAAGFEQVVLVSPDKKVLGKARDATLTVLNQEQIKRVRFLTPEQLFAFLETLEAKAAGREDTAPGSREVLTAKELEGLLKIDVKTIYSYAQRGLLPYVRIQSNLRFLKAEIVKWIEEHRFRPKPPTSRK
jgi:predicted DNA-binding transcriptional regulator AlpA